MIELVCVATTGAHLPGQGAALGTRPERGGHSPGQGEVSVPAVASNKGVSGAAFTEKLRPFTFNRAIHPLPYIQALLRQMHLEINTKSKTGQKSFITLDLA